ncbi:hypothetical protein NIES4103_08510 [Nostoc sp. NIES-4103]|nr:hypothetical protein NIES4103_08510 [Nostoc sp. NIES-4103]
MQQERLADDSRLKSGNPPTALSPQRTASPMPHAPCPIPNSQFPIPNLFVINKPFYSNI